MERLPPVTTKLLASIPVSILISLELGVHLLVEGRGALICNVRSAAGKSLDNDGLYQVPGLIDIVAALY